MCFVRISWYVDFKKAIQFFRTPIFPYNEKKNFVKHQQELYLIDVRYQTSTRTLSGWYLISIIYSRYMFSLHFRVCRFQKRYTILKIFLTGLCHFCLYEKTFFVKYQPKLYLVDVWYQTSTKTVPAWCLISNINQNCTWLMFDIKRQPKLYLVDVWYQMSTRTLSG